MPKVFTSKTQKTGEIGEHVAVRYLQNKGYSVTERNYTKKWGEIDIIAKKGKILHFIEVKSKTAGGGDYHVEEQMHSWKQDRLRRTIQTYLAENKVGEWQFDLLTVELGFDLKEAKVELLENIILQTK